MYACSQFCPVAAATARTAQSPTLLPRGFGLNLCHMSAPPFAFIVPECHVRRDNERTTKDKYKLIQLLQNKQKNKGKFGDYACSYVLKDVDIEDIDSSFALKALSMQQQGVFQIGYMSTDKTLGVSAVKIKAARENAGLTIRALSEKTGLSTATIQHAEAGKPTRMTTLKKIAAACNVSAEELQG